MTSAAADNRQFSAAIFRRGTKAELFEDAASGEAEYDEASQLSAKLDDLHTVWSAPRIGKDLSAAVWRPALRAAEVKLQRGKLMSHIGFTRAGRLYLHPEEAAYLVDRANLLLFLEEAGGRQRLLSLQETLSLMVSLAGMYMRSNGA
jgi:hypothetical protein